MERNISLLTALLFIIVTSANATVIDVVGYDIGLSGGRTGTSTDPLEPNDTIGIKIVLHNNPYPGWPSYNGYILKEANLRLEVSGPGCLTQKFNSKGVPIPPGVHPDFSYTIAPIDCNGIDPIHLLAPECGVPQPATTEDVDLVWDLLLDCTGNGEVFINLSINNPGLYSEFYDPGCNYNWLPIYESDLGDLYIYQGPQWPDCWLWPAQCHGDCHDNDGDVDNDDFLVFKPAFGSNDGDANYDPCADLNRDGHIDNDDFLIFKPNFGKTGLSGCTPP